jgi:predicted transcriptional regulator
MKIKSEINRILSNYTVKDIVINQYKSLQQHHTILDAIKMVLSSQISIFMVYFKTNLVGYISKRGIIKAIKEKKLTASVEQYMNKEINYLDAGKTLLETEILFKTHQCQLFVVQEENQIIGILDKENIEELKLFIRTNQDKIELNPINTY